MYEKCKVEDLEMLSVKEKMDHFIVLTAFNVIRKHLKQSLKCTYIH